MLFGADFGHDPRHVDVNQKNQIGLVDQTVAFVSNVAGMIAWKIHVLRVDLAHGNPNRFNQVLKSVNALGVSAQIGGDDQRPLTFDQSLHQGVGLGLRKTKGFAGGPMGTL